jgi:hypothetical protein
MFFSLYAIFGFVLQLSFDRYFGDMDIPPGKTIEDAQKLDTEKWFPRNVRTLRSRWTPGMNFGQFTEATYAAFY